MACDTQDANKHFSLPAWTRAVVFHLVKLKRGLQIHVYGGSVFLLGDLISTGGCHTGINMELTSQMVEKQEL